MNGIYKNMDFIFNESKVGTLAQNIDWSKHRLGPVKTWSQTLRIAVSLMLNSRFPMFISWGEDQVFLYNDAYASILGKKHPKAFGERFPEIWSEIWSDLIPLVESVNRGNAVYREDLHLVMNRNGFDEDAYFTFSYSPIRNEFGKVCGLHCACVETTDRVERSRQLEDSEARLAFSLEGARMGIWSADLKTNKVTHSEASRKILGFDRDYESPNQAIDTFIHPEDREHVAQVFSSAVQSGELYKDEYRIVRPNGEVRWIKARGLVRSNQKGAAVDITGTVMDVTEEKLAQFAVDQANSAIENERENFRNLFKQTPELVVIFKGPQHTFEFVNESHVKVLGFNATGMTVRRAQPESVELHGILDNVYRTGQTSHLHQLPVTIGEKLRYFDLTYSARKNSLGQIDGIMNLGLEVTNQVEASEALKESEAKFRTIADTMPQMVWTAHSRGEIDYANAKWYEFTGFTPEKTMGFGFADAIHPEDAPNTLARYAEAIENGTPLTVEHRFKSVSDGNYRWHLVRAVPLMDNEGQVRKWLGTCTDIQDQKLFEQRLQESESKLRDYLETMPQMAFIGEADGNMSYFNQRHYDYFGIDREAQQGWKWINQPLHHPEDLQRTIERWNHSVSTGEPYEIEYRLRRHDGVYRWHLARATALRDKEGKIVQWFGTNTDIHEQKKVAEELAQSKLSAEEASVAKSRFLANMSHEIRTPLGVMMGFADLALDQPSMNEEVSNYLKAIKRNGVLLTKIIGEVLDLAKIEASKIEIENARFNLPKMIDEVLSFLNIQAADRGIVLSSKTSEDLPVFIRSDSTRLRQILINLVGNAVKFTEKGSVTLVARMRAFSGDKADLEFIVQDTGIGLSAKQKERLFQPFTQADSSMTRKYGGTGLGLSLSKQLAQAMGGDVRLQESIESIGSIFVCTIKAEVIERKEINGDNQEAHLAKVEPSQNKNELDGICVLLVEDSTDNQVLFSRYLKSAGAKVVLADNGEEGVNMAFDEDHDLVLMDIQMPKKNGHEATAELRKLGFNKPIIALTAHAMKEERDKAMREGFTDYLTKPLDRQTLIEAILRLSVKRI